MILKNKKVFDIDNAFLDALIQYRTYAKDGNDFQKCIKL